MSGPVTACRACGGTLSLTMADLGRQPPSNAFLAADAPLEGERLYPLRAVVCDSCRLVQLDYDVDPRELFGNYVYFSSYSDDWLRHAAGYCRMAMQRFSLGSDSLVVELASNDGYLLKNFVAAGVPVLGIDPSDTVARAAEAAGVPTLVEFFGEAQARKLVLATGQDGTGEWWMPDFVRALPADRRAHTCEMIDFERLRARSPCFSALRQSGWSTCSCSCWLSSP